MFSDPQKNVESFELEPEMIVADLGAGSGFYAINSAKAVKLGKVYAVDIQKELLERVKNMAVKEQLDNVELVWGDIEEAGGSKLEDGSVDAVIIANTLFQVENKKSLIDEAKRILKTKGKLLLVDWLDSYGGLGPKQSDIVGVQDAEDMFTAEGFKLERDISAGEHHYGLVFRKV